MWLVSFITIRKKNKIGKKCLHGEGLTCSSLVCFLDVLWSLGKSCSAAGFRQQWADPQLLTEPTLTVARGRHAPSPGQKKSHGGNFVCLEFLVNVVEI